MYENIGKKLKGLALAVFIIMFILSIVGGAIIIIVDDDLVAVGIVVMLVMPLVAWISSWFLYGFGELIDKVCDIEERMEAPSLQTKKHNPIATIACPACGCTNQAKDNFCYKCGSKLSQ